MSKFKILKMGAAIGIPVAASSAAIAVGVSQVKVMQNEKNGRKAVLSQKIASAKTEVDYPIDKNLKLNFSGITGAGTFDLTNLDIAQPTSSFLEYRFYVQKPGDTQQPFDSQYSSVIPTDLSNNQIVFVKLFIKDNMTNSMVLKTNDSVAITVSGLSPVKKVVADPVANIANLHFIGTSGLASVAPLNNIVVPEGVEIRFASSPTPIDDSKYDQSFYTTSFPTRLSNGFYVVAKAFVKPGFEDSVDLTAVAKTFIVSDLVTQIDGNFGVSNIAKPTFIGSNGSGTLMPITNNFDPNVEIKYAVSNDTLEPAITAYSSAIPQNLSLGQKVFIKAFIIDGTKYAFKEVQTPISFFVEGLSVQKGFSIPASSSQAQLQAYITAKLPEHTIWSLTTGSGAQQSPLPTAQVVDDVWARHIDGTTLKDDTFKNINSSSFGRITQQLSYEVPSSIRIIGSGFLSGSIGIGRVVINEGVTTLGRDVFSGIQAQQTSYIDHRLNAPSDFVSIVLPDSLTNIGSGAFNEAYLGEGFKIPATANFNYLNTFINVHIPSDCVWKMNGIEIPGPVAGAVIARR